MSAFFCLANTTVLGKLILKSNTETYSATSTAFCSGTTMKDAEKAATTASNSAAISTTRKLVDSILTKYSTVLSDNVINSTIRNSLKTDIHPIIPIALKSIATSDGSNYSVDKNVNLVKYQMISVLDGETLTVPRNYTLNGPGIVRIGGTTAAQKSMGTTKSTSTCTAPTSIQISGAYTNTSDYNVSSGACYNVTGPTDPSDEDPVVFVYTNSANLTSSGTVTFANVIYSTSCFNTNGNLITDGSTITTVNLGTTASPSLFYISPYFPSVEISGENTFLYDPTSEYYTVVLTNPNEPITYESYSSELTFVTAVKNVQFTIVGGGGGGGDTDSKCRGQNGYGQPGGGGAGGSIDIIKAASYAASTSFAVTIAGGGKRQYQGHSSTVQSSGSSTIWTAVGGQPGESCLYNYASGNCCSNNITGGVGSGGGGSGGDANDDGSPGTNTTIYYNPNGETIPTTSSYYFGGGGAGGQSDGSNFQILGGLGGGQGGWATSTSNNIKGNKGEAYTGPNSIYYAAGAYFESGYPSTGGGGAGGSGNTGEGLYEGWVGGTGVVICTYQVA